MLFIQRSADQQQRLLCFKMNHLDDRLLQKLFCVRDKPLNKFEKCKEQHEALRKVLQDSLVLAATDLQRTLQASHEFRNQIDKMVNDMFAP